MTLAIMQPYLFPYNGYFQLLHAADKFVFYDDVSFIKQGWINRNRILINGVPSYFTMPVRKISSFTRICDMEIDGRSFPHWRDKFLKSLRHNYAKAPFYPACIPIVEAALDEKATHVGELAKRSVRLIAEYLDIRTEIVDSSDIYRNESLSAQERVLDICSKEQAGRYLNFIGGWDLYHAPDFQKQGVELRFIRSMEFRYPQFAAPFHPSLSIIDAAMFCGKERLVRMLDEYQLIKQEET